MSPRVQRFSLSDLALARPVTTLMVLASVWVLGWLAVFRLPLAYLPTEESARVFVRAVIARTSPEVLEREVVRPLEEQVAGISRLKRMQVGTGSWGVRMNLEFEPGTDPDAAKLELRDRLDRVRPRLPALVQRLEIGSYTNFDDPVMELQLSSHADLTRAYYEILSQVVTPIERLRGVARVEFDGVSRHELDIAADVQAMTRRGVTMASLVDTVRTSARSAGLGELRGTPLERGLRSPGLPAEVASFEALRVSRQTTETSPLAASPTDPTAALMPAAPLFAGAASASSLAPSLATQSATSASLGASAVASPDATARSAALGEVARVSIHPEEQRQGSRLNGRPAINLRVYAAAGASTVDVTQSVLGVLDQLRNAARAGSILQGAEVVVVHDQGAVILQTLGDLRQSGVYGGLLAICVLFAFLRRIAATLAAAVCIPLSVLASCAVLFVRGDELNCIVLLGLVLGIGMLIDNAVVIVEAIEHERKAGRGPFEAAKIGAREVGLATTASTLSTVIVFLPMMTGGPDDPMSTYFLPLGTTFTIGLIASLLVSQTAVPSILSRVPARWLESPTPRQGGVLTRLENAYGRFLGVVLRHPFMALLVGVGLASSSVYPLMHTEVDLTEFERKPDSLSIRLQLAGSRDHRRVEEHVRVMEEALLPHREELGIAALTCRFRDWGGDCNAYPSRPAQSQADLEIFEDRIRKVLPEQPGVSYRFGERQFHFAPTRDRRVIEFAVKGEDMGELVALAGRIEAHLRQTLPRADRSQADGQPEGSGSKVGFDTITSPFTDGSRELWVRPDPFSLTRFGLSVSELAQAAQIAFQGLSLGTVSAPKGELELRIRAASADAPPPDGGAPGEQEANLEQLRDLRIRTRSGQELPLGSLAELEIVRAPHWVQRVDRSTEVTVKVRFSGTDRQANDAAVRDAMASFVMPPGYTWGEGTAWRKPKSQNTEMVVNLGLCLVLVYAVMASLFESFVQPFVILVACLLGCFGGPWGLYLAGETIDSTALVGAFILIGIVVNNGIMLVDRAIVLQRRGLAMDDALVQAGRDRLRPILMTATTTILGLVPMLIHHPTLAGIYYHSIAILVTGGLLTSTLVTLAFLPPAYAIVEDFVATARETARAFLARRRDADSPAKTSPSSTTPSSTTPSSTTGTR